MRRPPGLNSPTSKANQSHSALPLKRQKRSAPSEKPSARVHYEQPMSDYSLTSGETTEIGPQPELFTLRPPGEPTLFRGIPYWKIKSGTHCACAELYDGQLIYITRQSAGQRGHKRVYANVPGHKPLRARHLKALLVELALIDQNRALTKSIQIKLKQKDDTDRALRDLVKDNHAALEKENEQLLAEVESEVESRRAAEAENARLRDELAAAKRQTPRVAEPQQIDFGGGFVLVLRPDLIRAVKNLGGDQLTMTQAFHVALIVGQLLYLVTKGCGKVMADGLRYIYGTYTEFQAKYFFFWSHRTIERSFVGAESLGLLTSKQPEGRFSRRKYYTPTPEAANLAASGKMAASSRQDGGFLCTR